MDTRASASVVGKRSTQDLRIWKLASKIKVRQGNRSTCKGNFLVITSFKGIDTSSLLGKFAMDMRFWILGIGIYF